MRKITEFCLNKAKFVVIILVLALNVSVQEVSAAWNSQDVLALINNSPERGSGGLMITGSDSILAVNLAAVPKTVRVILTGYSSTPDQTDNTPFVTASGTRVRDGVAAANFLAFGTKVKIPALFGDKVFVIEDRMARKHNDKIDIWFAERYLAKRFGIKEADVIILD